MALPVPLVPKHINNGECPHCQLIINRYPNFYKSLADWFYAFQKSHPEAHTSCAGRNYLDQEAAFIKKMSRAHYGESAHNYNAALDLFELKPDTANIYDRAWFVSVLQPNLAPWMEWYGKVGSPFYELPHVQAANWKSLAKDGLIKLVEVHATLALK